MFRKFWVVLLFFVVLSISTLAYAENEIVTNCENRYGEPTKAVEGSDSSRFYGDCIRAEIMLGNDPKLCNLVNPLHPDYALQSARGYYESEPQDFKTCLKIALKEKSVKSKDISWCSYIENNMEFHHLSHLDYYDSFSKTTISLEDVREYCITETAFENKDPSACNNLEEKKAEACKSKIENFNRSKLSEKVGYYFFLGLGIIIICLLIPTLLVKNVGKIIGKVASKSWFYKVTGVLFLLLFFLGVIGFIGIVQVLKVNLQTFGLIVLLFAPLISLFPAICFCYIGWKHPEQNNSLLKTAAKFCWIGLSFVVYGFILTILFGIGLALSGGYGHGAEGAFALFFLLLPCIIVGSLLWILALIWSIRGFKQ